MAPATAALPAEPRNDLPHPEKVRQLIDYHTREADFLRRLLRLLLRREREAGRRKGDGHAA